MKYNQKKKKENIEIFLFIMVMAVFAAVLGVMSLGEKMQPVNQIRKISSGWYYYDNGKRTEVTLPDTIQAEKGEELILYNDGITDLDAGKRWQHRLRSTDLESPPQRGSGNSSAPCVRFPCWGRWQTG